MELGVVRKWCLLGEGGFATVHSVRTKCPHEFPLALKVVHKSKLADQRAKWQIKHEVEIQASLHHRNILSLYGSFEDESCIYLMLELAVDGSLLDQLAKCRHFSGEQASKVNFFEHLSLL